MSSHTPKDAKAMAAILKDVGVLEYEPRIINQMLEFSYRYISDILDDAKLYSEYAKKKHIDADDVKLAIRLKADHVFSGPPPKELLMDLAKEKNAQPLLALKHQSGFRLPPDRYCLIQPNFRLRTGTGHTLVTPGQQSFPDHQQQFAVAGGSHQSSSSSFSASTFMPQTKSSTQFRVVSQPTSVSQDGASGATASTAGSLTGRKTPPPPSQTGGVKRKFEELDEDYDG